MSVSSPTVTEGAVATFVVTPLVGHGVIDAIFQTAAPCPPWLKRFWIELLGPEKVVEAFGSTEDIGHTTIRGDEWLAHPGSVGKPQDSSGMIRPA